MTLKEFFESKEKLAIHCNTKAKANRLMQVFDVYGKCWCNGDRFIANSSWHYYKDRTCYTNTCTYADKEWFLTQGYKIIEFDEMELGGYRLPKTFRINLDIKQMNDLTYNRARHVIIKINEGMKVDDKIHFQHNGKEFQVGKGNLYFIVGIDKDITGLEDGYCVLRLKRRNEL